MHTNCSSELRTQSLRETILQSDRRARTPSTPQTDVARPFQNIQSEDLSTLFQTFSVQATGPVQRSLPEGSLVHTLDDHHLRPPHVGVKLANDWKRVTTEWATFKDFADALEHGIVEMV